MNKKKITNIIIFAVTFFTVIFAYLIISLSLTFILGPEKASVIMKTVSNVFYCIVGLLVLICFFTLAFTVFGFSKYSKFFQEEMRYIGFSDKLFEEVKNREKKYSKNKYTLAYIESIIRMGMYYNLKKEYEKTYELFKVIDLDELKSSFSVESKHPSMQNLLYYVSFIDVLMATLKEMKKESECDELYEKFIPFYEANIKKDATLDESILEVKLNYLILKKDTLEVEKTLELYKMNNDAISELVFNVKSVELLKLKGVKDKDQYNEFLEKAREAAEKCFLKAYYLQVVDTVKNEANEFLEAKDEV